MARIVRPATASEIEVSEREIALAQAPLWLEALADHVAEVRRVMPGYRVAPSVAALVERAEALRARRAARGGG